MGRSGAVFPSIRTIPRGQTTEISVRTQPSIRFFPLPARNGPFRPFFGPQGAQMEHTLLVPHPEGVMRRPSQVHPGHTFSIILWGFKSENVIRTCLGGPRAKTRSRKRPKMAVGHWEKGRSRAVYESIRKIPTARSTEISVPSQTLIRFFPLMAENGPFRPFFGL